MSKIWTLNEGIVDTLLRAVRRSNLIADDANIDAIRNVNPTLSEDDRNSLVNNFSYGLTSGIGAKIGGPEDVWCFVDNDGTNPTTPYANLFYVAKGQNSPPVIDPYRMLMSIGSASSPNGPVVMTIGPNPTLITSNQDCPVMLTMGAGICPVLPAYYGTITATKDEFSITSALSGGTGSSLKLQSQTHIFFNGFSGSAFRTVGGFASVNSLFRFFIGPNVGTDSLVTEKLSGTEHWRISTKRASEEVKMYLAGSYPNTTLDPRIKFCVGGVEGVHGIDPNEVIVPAPVGQEQTTMLVVSPPISFGDPGYTARAAFYSCHRATDVSDYCDLNVFHSQVTYGVDAHRSRIYLMRITCLDGGGQPFGIFKAQANGNCGCAGAFAGGGGDLAEYFDVRPDLPKPDPGTVVVIGETGVEPSAEVASSCVLGVVSTKPSFVMNGYDIEITGDDDKVQVALSGTVPVKVTTKNGPFIAGKTLLVSAEGGMACAAPSNPEPGTIIGKALESVVQPGEEPITATIRMLVFMR